MFSAHNYISKVLKKTYVSANRDIGLTVINAMSRGKKLFYALLSLCPGFVFVFQVQLVSAQDKVTGRK